MNKNLKKILVTGAALLMFASVGVGINSNANASHNVGWRQITRATNLNAKRGKRVHLRKNQRVYVIKLTKNQKSAKIKMGRKYYYVNAKLLKQNQLPAHQRKVNKNKKTNDRKAIKRYKKNTKRIEKRHARKYTNQRKQNVKRLIKRVNKKTQTRRNRRRTNKKNIHVLKAHFRRSNDKKLLARSGFVDYMNFQIPGTNQYLHVGPDIMSKYAPNSRKAVIPKKVNVKKVVWLKGNRPFQKNPMVYLYNKRAHGWILQN